MKQITTLQKVLNFFVVKILVALSFCISIVILAQLGLGKMLALTSVSKEEKILWVGIAVALLSVSTYVFLFRFYEKRNIIELSTKKLFQNLLVGISLGVVLQSLTILVIYLKGGFTVSSVNSIILVLPSFVMAFTSAIFEEILFRGIVFRITEEKLGSYWALFISALIFGAMHLANPHSSVLASLGLAIQAGLLLAAAYIFARNLWFPIAIHFAWNFTQSGIFGVSTSGNSMGKSLLTTKINGAEWFTGGLFGPEGSVQATIFCLIAAVVLILMSHRQQKIARASWQRN